MSKRMAFVSLLIAGSVGVSASNDPPPAPVKRALLVGINVTRMRSVLVNRYGFDATNIVMLTDGKATRAAILAARDKLAADSHASDTVVVHYSGHGSRTPDLSGDETDNFDEAIVPVDSRTGTVHDITDDELNLKIASITQQTLSLELPAGRRGNELMDGVSAATFAAALSRARRDRLALGEPCPCGA